MLSKVITIAQQKGGTGKTTIAVHLALAFIKYHNLKVAIIDTDPQGSLGKWFMIRTEKKISNDNIRFGLRVPFINNLLSPMLLTVPLQLLAYHVALLKNCDIDKPRNLAKSVTVE